MRGELLVINVSLLSQVEESKPPTIAVSKPSLKKSFTVDVRRQYVAL